MNSSTKRFKENHFVSKIWEWFSPLINPTFKQMTDEITWYDDSFKVSETRFGLFVSETKEGRKVITAPTEQSCVDTTRFFLKGEIDGWPEPLIKYDGNVGGKL